jgi:hypothetical protein
MVISIEDSSDALMTLLWIREAWNLEVVGGDLPPVLVDTPAPVAEGVRADAPLAEWSAGWPELWRACLAHAARLRDPGLVARLKATKDGSPERADVLRALMGPHWRHVFGHAALERGYREWSAAVYEQQGRRPPPELLADPEHVSLDELIAAWKAGLTTVVQLPCRGDYARVVGPHGLLVTEETRADPARYRRALSLFV